ncbi:MAG: hypothetical protein HKN35_15980 [Woeseia sp.]|nr:hypothetical protein [Woeseia sp.]
MAVTQTLFTPSPDPFFYRRGSSAGILPIGEFSFSVRDEVITAGGAGNEQSVVLQMNLPQNYAYRLRDIFMTIGASTNTFSLFGSARITDGTAANRTIEYSIPFESQGQLPNDQLLTALPTQVYSIAPGALPQQMLLPQRNTGAFMSANVFNATQNGPAGTCWARATVLIYDIAQAFEAGANAPIPTVSR